MNIIIEGPDAAGKTTLAEKIKAKYPFMQYVHSTANTPNDYDYHSYLLTKCNGIYDRFFMGELVYPEIYGRPAKLSLAEARQLMNEIIDNTDIFIVMYASNIDTLKERLIARNELNYLDEIEKQNILFKSYGQVFNAYGYRRFFMVDISKEGCYEDLDRELEEIFENYGNSLNYVYRQICRDLLEKGHPADTAAATKGNSKELNNYSFTINDISNNVVTLKSRNISLNYLAGELLWYWQGRNDLDFINHFSSFWKRISDDGETANSAYGYILQKKHGFDQIEKIIELLKKDPASRRAVLNINVPNEHVIETKDEMCTIALVFYVRNNKLNCTGIMRSNDVNFGLTYDITYFTQLQKYIADRLGIATGSYTHFTTSMHFYDGDYDLIKKIAYGNLETINSRLDIDKLLAHNSELIDYIDNDFVNKDDFNNKLIDMGIIT